MINDLENYSLPDIFGRFPNDIHETNIVVSFPENTFLENIAINDSCELFVTSLEEGLVYKIKANGEKEIFAGNDGKLTGIFYLGNSSFLLTGWDKNGVPSLYLIKDKDQVEFLHKPIGASFLNGMTALSEDIFLICDAYKGCIWRYDLKNNSSSVWLKHELLAKASEDTPMPAANGIKIFHNDVYVSNTEKQLLIKIPLINNGPGEPEVLMDRLNLDDFAFDADGNLYAATHIYNSVVKITPQKQVTIIAGEEQGLSGTTAVAFGKSEDDKGYIYVTTNGGMSLPPTGGIQNARIIKIKIN
jgi:hypothetical protein